MIEYEFFDISPVTGLQVMWGISISAVFKKLKDRGCESPRDGDILLS
jgi:hypothetical protein